MLLIVVIEMLSVIKCLGCVSAGDLNIRGSLYWVTVLCTFCYRCGRDSRATLHMLMTATGGHVGTTEVIIEMLSAIQIPELCAAKACATLSGYATITFARARRLHHLHDYRDKNMMLIHSLKSAYGYQVS